MRSRLPSYHNHTRWSDGVASLDEFVAVASAYTGEIGISDHFVLSPHGPVDWSMPVERLADYTDAVLRCAAPFATPHSPFAVRLGVEADYFPESVDDVARALRRHPFDFVIGAVHFVGQFPLDSRAADWACLNQEQVDDVWRRYWRLVTQMARTGLFDIAAHLDLPKKFGYRPSVDLAAEEAEALDAIRDAGMAIEINTAGWALPAGEQYPAQRFLEGARTRSIPIVLSADAHRPDHATRFFARAIGVAREAGYHGSCRFVQRACIVEDFPAEE
ncbi:MAG: histidinol-phosphatase HisJ family protein [Chthonomonadales bacterium]